MLCVFMGWRTVKHSGREDESLSAFAIMRCYVILSDHFTLMLSQLLRSQSYPS